MQARSWAACRSGCSLWHRWLGAAAGCQPGPSLAAGLRTRAAEQRSVVLGKGMPCLQKHASRLTDVEQETVQHLHANTLH